MVMTDSRTCTTGFPPFRLEVFILTYINSHIHQLHTPIIHAPPFHKVLCTMPCLTLPQHLSHKTRKKPHIRNTHIHTRLFISLSCFLYLSLSTKFFHKIPPTLFACSCKIQYQIHISSQTEDFTQLSLSLLDWQEEGRQWQAGACWRGLAGMWGGHHMITLTYWTCNYPRIL